MKKFLIAILFFLPVVCFGQVIKQKQVLGLTDSLADKVNDVYSRGDSLFKHKAGTETLVDVFAGATAPWLGKYYDIFITGQSNAWGASGPTAFDTASNSRVLVWNHAQPTPGWIMARINERPFRRSGYNSLDGGGARDDLNGSANSAFYMAKKYAAKHPNDTVRIVMAIGDGLPSLSWFNGIYQGRIMDSVLERGAASGINPDVFLYVQGESDGTTAQATFFATIDSMEAVLRRQTWFSKTTPIVLSGLPQVSYGARPSQTYADTILQKFDYDADVWDGYAYTDSLHIANDSIHYDAQSLHELGTVRYWQTAEALPYRNIERDNALAGGGSSNGATKELRFVTGAALSPAAGDSTYENIAFGGRHLRIWRDGLFIDTSTSNGYELSGSTITLHPPLTLNEKVYVEIADSVKWQNVALVSPGEDISFTGADMVHTGDYWTTAAGGGYGHTGLSSLKLASGQNGYIYCQWLTGDGNVAFGFNTANAAAGYAGMEAALLIDPGTGNLNKVDGGTFSAVSPTATLANGDYVRIKRAGSTLTMEKSSTGITWTTVYTYTFTSSADLYIVCDIYTAYKLRLPKGVNLN